MVDREFEILAVGAGPANLGLAVAVEELAPDGLASDCLLIERDDEIAWQRGMLMPWAQSQVSFLKDLVSLRNPRSRYSFLNYLHSVGRLDAFVNLATFTPYRIEISNYLRWVADSLERVKVEYGRRCVDIEPIRDACGALAGWATHLADGSTIRSTTLVLGVGRDPLIPTPFVDLPPERIVHSTQYLPRMAELATKPPDEQPNRVVVIGGAQSSAEMLAAVRQDLPHSRPTLLMRSVGFTTYQSSRFTNELYYPSFVDDFYHAPPPARAQMLREMHHTNYSGLSASLLEELYRRMYLERLAGEERTRIKTMTDVTAARMAGDDVLLTVRERTTGRVQAIACDLVLLGTGYQRQMPAVIRRLATDLGLTDVRVTRNYRLVTGMPGPGGCYLQGVNEETHGIADSLLSVVGPRAAEIVLDIVSRRGSGVPGLAEPSFTSP
jgi:L-ornithine N5-oxygenase